MTVERLNLVLRSGDARHELPNAVDPFKRFTIPSEGRVGSVEVGEVVDAGRRVVCRVVQAGEVVRRTGGNLDTDDEGARSARGP